MEKIIETLTEIVSSAEKISQEEKHPLQSKPKDYTETESVLHDILTENTGAHILDSGGAYGRAWERNRKIFDFRKHTISQSEDYITKSLFKFLNEHLTYDKVLDKKFHDFANSEDNKDKSWGECIELFKEEYSTNDGYISNCGGYTYNDETALSQDFVYETLYIDSNYYFIIQTHNGCDARGGFSTPRVFSGDEGLLCDITHLTGNCDCGYADSDNAGYSWYDSDFSKSDGFPEEWKYSKESRNYKCSECNKEVYFH
jgi:hypothetical protein